VFTGGQIDLLNVDSEFLCKFLGGLAALGRILDRTDSLIGPVQRQKERRHVILRWFAVAFCAAGAVQTEPVNYEGWQRN
jgi:hypothetical protein